MMHPQNVAAQCHKHDDDYALRRADMTFDSEYNSCSRELLLTATTPLAHRISLQPSLALPPSVYRHSMSGFGGPRTRPLWAEPYFTRDNEMDLSAYLKVTGDAQRDRLTFNAYARAQPVEACQLLRALYNSRVPCGTNYSLWLLTQSMVDLVMFGNDPNPPRHLPRETYYNFVFGPGCLAELCFFMIALDEKAQFFEESPLWIRGVLDLLSGILGLYHFYNEGRLDKEANSPATKLLRRGGCAIWGSLWENRWLFEDGNRQEEFSPEAGKGLRFALCNSIFEFFRIFRDGEITLGEDSEERMLTEFHDHDLDNLARISLFCWMRRSGTSSDGAGAIEFELIGCYALLIFHKTQTADRRAFVQAEIMEPYGVHEYLEHMAQSLRRPDLNGGLLVNVINSLQVFRADVPSFSPHFASSGLLHAMRTATERQMSLLEREDLKASFLITVMFFYDSVCSRCPLTEGAGPIIRQCNYVKLLSLATRLSFHIKDTSPPGDGPPPISLQAGDDIMGKCLTALTDFIEVAQEIVTHSTSSSGRNGRKSGLHLNLRDVLKVEWFPTYANLIVRPAAARETMRQTKLRETWVNLGEIVGLDLEREYAEVKREGRRRETCCAWKDCQWHRVPPPNPPRVCKGCGEVRYCSKTCQTDDWRAGHKKDCRRLK
ncbi:hypothetical protein PENSPDRAFT_95170 [Peniophora sp. CONT]|nr:hypothetical protein PENSPDRAFT_95170 [Peniophora sp. CONT]